MYLIVFFSPNDGTITLGRYDEVINSLVSSGFCDQSFYLFIHFSSIFFPISFPMILRKKLNITIYSILSPTNYDLEETYFKNYYFSFENFSIFFPWHTQIYTDIYSKWISAGTMKETYRNIFL